MVRRVERTIEVKGECFNLTFDTENRHTAVECNGRAWNNLEGLLEDKGDDLSECPIFLADFVFRKLLRDDYRWIEDVREEREWYQNAIRLEKENPHEAHRVKLTLHGGPYDIDELHGPRIEQNALTFCVIQKTSGVPMHVHFPLDYQINHTVDIRPFSKLSEEKKRGCELL